MTAYRLISSDSHVTMPDDAWQEYLDPEFRERAPHVERTDDGDFRVFEGRRTPIMTLDNLAGKKPEEFSLNVRKLEDQRAGAGDPAARLADMDIDGVDAEVLYVGGPLQSSDPELRLNSVRGYNRWLSDYASHAPARLLGMAAIPIDTPERAAEEVHFAATQTGLAGGYIPLFPPEGDYGDPLWNPMWEAFLDTGLPIGLHVGGRRPGTPTVSIYDSAPRFMTGLTMSKLTMAESVSELIHGLVMQRHPGLKFIAVEGQIGWISFFLYYSDHIWEKHRHWTKSELEHPPSHYFHRQVFAHVHGGPRRPPRARPHRCRQHHVGERLPALRDHVAELQGADRRMVHALRRRREGQDPLEELRHALRPALIPVWWGRNLQLRSCGITRSVLGRTSFCTSSRRAKGGSMAVSARGARTAARLAVVALVGATTVHSVVAASASERVPASDPAVQVTPVGTAGSGTPATSRASELAGTGYTETEYFMSGNADMYSGSSGAPATPTGQQVPYTTRILVRTPTATKFSGRVMVEPFNTSGTNELDAAWTVIGSRLVENGDAWIGVTTRYSSVGALNERDAARYASLKLASTGQTWGILTDIARLVRSGGQQSPLRGLAIKRVYMAGYSQSAVDIVTYANAINPLETRAGGGYLYEGYLIMGRDASATPLDAGAEFLPKFEFRPDGKGTSPIINVETQTDAQGFSVPAYTNPGGASVRRADSDARTDRFRLYEIPGASHAPKIPTCDHQGTSFPLRYFERAALTNLYAWSEHGTVPPRTPRITMTTIDTVSTPSLDADGNAAGRDAIAVPRRRPVALRGQRHARTGVQTRRRRDAARPRDALRPLHGRRRLHAEVHQEPRRCDRETGPAARRPCGDPAGNPHQGRAGAGRYVNPRRP